MRPRWRGLVPSTMPLPVASRPTSKESLFAALASTWRLVQCEPVVVDSSVRSYPSSARTTKTCVTPLGSRSMTCASYEGPVPFGTTWAGPKDVPLKNRSRTG